MTNSDNARKTETNSGPTAATTSEGPRATHRPTLKDVSHTHPDTDEVFGTAMAYKRGPVVAADGGERNAVDGDATGGETETEEDEAEDEYHPDADGDGSERMRDVAHEPPNGDEVNRVHERGGEGRPET